MAPWGNRLLSPSSRAELVTDPVAGGSSASSARSDTRPTDSDILDNALEIHSLPPPPPQQHANFTFSSSRPARTSSHGRSMSQPFPPIFHGRKKPPPPATRFESTDDEETSPIAKRGSSYNNTLGKQKVTEKGVCIGTCMTCASTVRWPKELDTFRCTTCQSINDLKPIVLEVRRGERHRTPVTARTGTSTGSRFVHNVPPLSLPVTKRLVDQCITAFLQKRLMEDDILTSSPVVSPPQSPSWNVPIYDSRGGESYGKMSEECTFETTATAFPIRLANRSRNESMELRNKFSFEINQSHSAPYSSSTPGSFLHAHMEQRDRDLGFDRSKNDPSGRHSFEAENEMTSEHRRPNLVPSIFRALEDYINSCFGSLECINASFSTTRPNMAPRAASEGGRSSLPVPPIERPRLETQYPELDAKTLLLGNFAENGSWWTGGRPDQRSPERSRTHRGTGDHDATNIVTVKSPQIDLVALNEWYSLVIHAGRFWRRRLDHLLESDTHASRIRHPSQSELEEIDHQIQEAQFHVRRVLMTVTESLLKRPGRLLTEPDHLRFLLIIFTNPLLYPTNEASKQMESRSRSRSRSRETRTIISQGSTEARNQSAYPRSPSKSNVGKGNSSPNSGIIKRLLGLMANVSNECHHHLVNWFARYSDAQFQKLVDLIGSFVTYRLLRQHGQKREVEVDPTAGLVPNMPAPGRNSSAALHAALGVAGQSSKKNDGKRKPVVYNDDWQIQAAAKVMALLVSANNSGILRRGEAQPPAGLAARQSVDSITRERSHIHGQIVPTSEFYNTLVDHSDLIADFEAWEGKKARFAFCQFPFFLSIWAKIQIMEYDARRQMEAKAKEAFFEGIMSRRNLNQYLTLRVRRDCLVEDSLKSVSEYVGSGSEEIKKALRIEFKGEEGVDAGGLRKEWFLLLVRDVFNPEYGMFTYDEDSKLCYFNPSSFETTDQFFLVGVVLGLAIYNSTILDVALPPFAFRKLLAAGPPPAPGASTHAKPFMTYTLEDLAEYKPALANGLRQLLEYEGDVESTFCRDFVADVERYGVVSQVPLCPDGEKRSVTNSNRREFVDLYVRYLLDTAVTRQFEPFKRGFFTVCGGNALCLFRPEEVELLIRGSDEPLDIASLRAVAVYQNWGGQNAGENEPVVQWFWESFQAANPKAQRKLLTFITGSDRIPAMGATNLVIKLSCLGDDSPRYPVARTCFNMLSLWRYSSKEKLESMIWRAVNESEGFGLK